MCILKYKINRALQKQQQQHLEEHSTSSTGQDLDVQNQEESPQRRLRERVRQPRSPKTLTPKGSTSGNNVMKNYSRIFTVFALSSISAPYRTPILQRHKISFQTFTDFINSRKKAANCIKGLRESLLLVTDADTEEVASMKQIFQEICSVFLKFFCVNWIFNGKIVNKSAHLSYRLKLLRKIRNPSTFIYLEDTH